jgi:type VI secretion system secreted protein Hcp
MRNALTLAAVAAFGTVLAHAPSVLADPSPPATNAAPATAVPQVRFIVPPALVQPGRPAPSTETFKVTMTLGGPLAAVGPSVIRSAEARDLVSPRDVSSGLPSGKRMHKPIVITKELSAASPVLFHAAATKSVLADVTLTYSRWDDAKHADVVVHTIKLTNATVIAASRSALPKTGAQVADIMIEQIAFQYQTITWTTAVAGKTQSYLSTWSE